MNVNKENTIDLDMTEDEMIQMATQQSLQELKQSSNLNTSDIDIDGIILPCYICNKQVRCCSNVDFIVCMACRRALGL